ncbi:MAG: hypothetical protein J5935_06030 [Lachnospiraceae bacterium]|nr:hypothetical protein [Lachnospiraceae bacterium]
MVQVISIVVPGIAVQIAAGIIYAWWKAFFACYIGFVCGHALVFFIVRRIHAKNGRFVDKYIPGITGRDFVLAFAASSGFRFYAIVLRDVFC